MPQTSVIPRAHRDVGSVYGLAGLLLAGAVHASTFTPTSLSPDHPLFWALHIGIFPLFLPMVFRLRVWSETRSGLLGFRTSRLRWREVLAYFPPWAIALAAVLFGYAMLNFLLATSHLPAAGHSSSAQPLDPEQARYTVRAFSGHWLIFYAIPTLYFAFVPAAARPTESARNAAV